MRPLNRIILHCSATEDNPEVPDFRSIRRYHKSHAINGYIVPKELFEYLKGKPSKAKARKRLDEALAGEEISKRTHTILVADNPKNMSFKGDWSDIGYHYIVERGEAEYGYVVYVGRPLERAGAHCRGHNADSVGLCLIGSYDIRCPSDEQYTVVAKLCWKLMREHSIKEIKLHRDFTDKKTCPGVAFHLDEVIARIDAMKDIERFADDEDKEIQILDIG